LEAIRDSPATKGVASLQINTRKQIHATIVKETSLVNLSIPIDQFIGPDAEKTISLTNSSADGTTLRERLTKHGDVDVPQHNVAPKHAPEAK
jgi:hypothetical protein